MSPQRPDPQQGALPLARSIGEVEILLVALTAIYFLLASDTMAGRTAWGACTATYLALLGVIRLLPASRARPGLRVQVQVVLMVLFLAALSAIDGPLASPLMHLCLLPVLVSAMLLPRSATAWLLALVLSARLAAGVAVGGLAWLTARSLGLVLADMAPALLAAFLTHGLRHELARSLSNLRDLAGRDELTGLLSHVAFRRLLRETLETARAQGVPCAVLLVDVDNLAAINERFGHDRGDRALAAVAAALRRAIRSSDTCGRFGGDRFAVLLPGCGGQGAEIMAGRIRHQVFAATQDFDYAMRRLSVTTGVAVQPEDGLEAGQLLRAADQALRRNRDARPGPTGGPPAARPAPR